MQKPSVPRARKAPRNPFAVALRKKGHAVIPSKKAYTRKGRSKDRTFDVTGTGI